MHTALDNSLNRGNINEITTWLMPRYSAGVEKSTTSGEKWTAPSNGWVVGRCQLPNTATTYHFYVNDVVVANLMAYECSIEETVMFPVTAGDEVYTDVPDGGYIKAVTFYPCKGVSKEPPRANFTVTGNPTISEGVASGFTYGDYITWDYDFAPELTDSWELQTAINLDGNYTNNSQAFIGQVQYVGKSLIASFDSTNKKIEIDICPYNDSDFTMFLTSPDNSISGDTKYYIKVSFDGSNTYTLSISTDKQNWTTTTLTGDQIKGHNTLNFGGHCWQSGNDLNGEMYLNETKLLINGVVAWQPYS